MVAPKAGQWEICLVDQLENMLAARTVGQSVDESAVESAARWAVWKVGRLADEWAGHSAAGMAERRAFLMVVQMAVCWADR